jgi:hypothetical protein
MKPKAFLIITFLCITVSLITNAQQVDSATALTVAKNFAYENYAFRDNIAYSSIDAHIQQIITSDDETPLLYFINISPKGYIVVSGDMRDYPICVYDEDESWSDDSMDLLPDGAKWFIDSYIEQIDILSKEKFDAAEEIQLLWDTYLDFNKLIPEKSRAENTISRFGDIHWDQTQYYNAQCPGGHSVPYISGFDNRCPVGCVAVAVGQIMRYWHWPYSGIGSRTYTDPANIKKEPCDEADPSYGSLSTNFNKNYNWGSMPFVLTTYHNNTAELLKDAGYAVYMNYAYCSSGAYIHDARDALVNNFKFNSLATLEIKDNVPSWDTWENMMKGEVNMSRPFYYRGSKPKGGGHAFVGYGYKDIGTSYTVFRFNWGWGGSNNNTWFRVRDNGSEPLIQYSSNQQMIKWIYPNASPCLSCPNYDFNITPTSAWKTHSGFHTFNACRMYRVSVTANKTYIFKTGCGNGATADFNTEIYVYNENCNQVAYNNDGCEAYRSKVTWKAPYTGYAYVKIKGYSTQKGSYTMAYKMVDELIWTGTSGTNWNTAGNWNEDMVPDENINVIIPSNTTWQPYIYASDAKCDNLTINSGATLTVGGYTLNVSNNMNINGNLAMNNVNGEISAKDVLWKSGSTANFTANSEFRVSGNWEFQAGSNANLTNGTVRFRGFPNNHSILCKSASSAFNDIVLSNFTLIYTFYCHLEILTSSNQNLKINGNIQIPNGASFKNYSTKDLILKGNIINNGTFECHAGTVRLSGTNQSLMMNTGDYFNNLTFNQSGTVTINDANINILEVKKDVVIKSGVFNIQNRIMRVGGDWTNEKGSGAFIAGTGRVIFNGASHQYVNSSENFNILEVDKGAALRVDNVAYTVKCNQYEWKKGGIDVLKGTFTALDLVNNGIYGNYYVNPGGTINLHQDASSWIDLNGKFNFNYGGTINVYGGSLRSYWSYDGDAEVYMNGGVLDFKDQGIYIYNSSSYTFTHNITGGTIRTSKGLYCGRTDFTPAGGTFEFYGNSDSYLDMISGSNLRNVLINKSSKEDGESLTGGPVYDQRSGQLLSDGTRANNISLNSNIDILGNFTINAGLLNTWSKQVAVSGNVAINNGGQLSVGAGGGLAMSSSKSVTVNNGGLIQFNGTAGTQSKITRKSSGYYALNIESGGKIAAVHTIFEYMNTNGVNLKSGAIVDPANVFTSCILRNGQSGGRLLTIENDQTFSVNYAMFPNNSWGGNFNVYKSVNSGVVTFGGHSGEFSGGSHEYDPYHRIHWGGEVAGNVTLQGVDVVSGQDICFDASNTLTVAGGGNTFVVQDGGNVNLIAGHNICILEGSSVCSGAYLHAFISNEYCTLPPVMLAVEEDNYIINEVVSEKSSEVLETRTNDLFRVYPNPTKGIFTLELNSVNESDSVKIEIFNLLGEYIFSTEQQSNSHYQFDLSGNKPGVYFIRVMCGEKNRIEKLIKQ